MKYKFKILGLDCPNCAKKIESKLNNYKEFNDVSVNFSKQLITLNSNINEVETKREIMKIIKKTDSNVTIYEDDKNSTFIYDIIRIIIGSILGILGLVYHNNILIVLGYFMLLIKTGYLAIKGFILSFTIDEKILITTASIGAYLIGSKMEGLIVVFLYEIGKLLELTAINNSRRAITKLMDIRPEYANVISNNELVKVDPHDVKVGDIITVLKGERVPLDGIIIHGNSKLNLQALTGESRLKTVGVNDKILSGSINNDNILTVKVTDLYADSTVAKILDLTENATFNKTKTETLIMKISKVYTPVILILAIVLLLLLPLLGVSYDIAIYRALSFMVIACPCAIVISVPLAYFSGMGAASKEGILIKGSEYLELSSKIKEIIFDKTGTLTTGEFSKFELEVLDDKYSKEKIISYLVSGEELSTHPIAHAILKAFPNGKKVRVSEFKEVSGKGITFYNRGEIIKIGSAKYCRVRSNVDNDIYITIDGDVVGVLKREEALKKNIKAILKEIKKLGIKIKVYTGDNKESALKFAKKLSLTDIEYELLPQDKYHLLAKEIKYQNQVVAFVGDGINDAPSIALADVGFSLGGVGSDAAIESADIVIMNDEIEKIVTTNRISKMTMRIIKENLIFSLGVKVTVLLLLSLGLTNMLLAVFADTGLTLLTILNTTRILRKK